MRKRTKTTSPAPVELNGHDRPTVLPPNPNPKTPTTPFFIRLTSKRKAVVMVRLSAIAAVWEDQGSLDGPFFVQAGGRTFHPGAESFSEIQNALCLLPST